ncbi:MBL fold metallo-hydrolase [Mangrovicoccus sp. HB161399]|uniref:MBL fold metallo-hydrolase n=1 Tax=Mangrovicoccus sp. HB161399 TaxID=2720392 RepID=UPI0015557ED1|nr:MBL fold metallo-hydrolase [Mangrovicoccus sp. HB161399]
MAAQAEFDPDPGKAEEIAPGLRRILAPNPSPMTFRGTNTYLIGRRELALVDPGPDDPAHLSALLAAIGGARLRHILVTHSHRDHSGLVSALARATGAPVLAFGGPEAGRSAAMAELAAEGLIGGGEGTDTSFAPDRCLADGESLELEDGTMEALHTPGHMGNHLCFAWNGAIFSGDIVMGWSSSLVSPPDGDLADFYRSCARLRARPETVLYPAHGAPVADPAARIDALVAHRRGREAQILAALAEGPGTLPALTERIYHDVGRALWPAASRNLLAHLVEMSGRGLVSAEPALSPAAVFSEGQEQKSKSGGKTLLHPPGALDR